MLTFAPFRWRTLSPNATLEHALGGNGALLVRMRGAPGRMPFDDVDTSGARVALADLGLAWLRTRNGDGWMLHSEGPPDVAHDTLARWGDAVAMASALLSVDERFLVALLAPASQGAKLDARGFVRRVLTLPGYPARSHDDDAGDPLRDAEDWRATGGMRSLHGLLPIPPGVAVKAFPGPFQRLSPSHYRDVLADPIVSIGCTASLLRAAAERAPPDPLAVRSGMLGQTTGVAGMWGVPVDDLALASFVAAWNDDARVRGGEAPSAPAALAMPSEAGPPKHGELLRFVPWAIAGVAVWHIAKAKLLYDQKRAAERESDEELEDDPEHEDDDASPALLNQMLAQGS